MFGGFICIYLMMVKDILDVFHTLEGLLHIEVASFGLTIIINIFKKLSFLHLVSCIKSQIVLNKSLKTMDVKGPGPHFPTYSMARRLP